MEFRNLKAQYARLRQEIDKAIGNVMDSAQFIGGEVVNRLERTLADYTGVSHCISCANGTDALEIALTAMGVGKGDAVFVPDLTFFSTAEAVATVGAIPVVVDVCTDTFNLSAESLENAIIRVISDGNLKPKAVIPVDLYGLPADYPRIKEIARKHNLLILEDAAQGFGGKIGDKKACSFGDIAITSFFPAKPLGCYGDGGAMFTDNDEWADIMRSLCVHGKGEHKYDNVRIGRNSRLDAIQAAILEVKFRTLVEFELDAVNRAAKYYNDAIGDRFRVPTIPEGFYSSFAQYTIKLESENERDSLAKRLAEKNIPTMIYFPIPIHRQKAFSEYRYLDADFPITERLVRTILSLPIGADIEEEDIAFIVKSFN